MRRSAICTLGLLAAAGSLCADWKITTESTVQGQRSVRTEYYKGTLTRSDLSFNGHRRVLVMDRATYRQVWWDLDLRQYVVIEPRPAFPTQLRQAEANGPRPVLRIEMTTTDTGERETLLGRPARHFVTTEKRYWEEKPGEEAKLQSETSKDAWYVDAPGLPGQGTGALYLGFSGQRQPVVQGTQTGPKPTGFIVREKQTTRYVDRPGNDLISENTTEVTELSANSLSQNLFEPPAGFQRVRNFPGEQPAHVGFLDEMQQYWNQFVDYLNGLFS